MSAGYTSRYEAVFTYERTYGTTVKYIKKCIPFVSKWVKRYSDVKNVDDLLDRCKSFVENCG